MNKANYFNKFFYINLILTSLFFLFAILFRFYTVNKYGMNVPYWDQWDAEAYLLYKPIIEGNFQFPVLVSAHNEHHIFFTRILAIALFEFNSKIWSPILEMFLNGFISICSITVLMSIFIYKFKYFYQKIMYLFLVLFIISIPFGWENILAGFQSQFYIFILFGLISIYGISNFDLFSFKWYLSFLVLCLSPLTMAGGFIGMISCIFILLVKNRFKRVVIPILILLILIGLSLLYTPHIVAHENGNAHNIGEFINALLTALSWPYKRNFIFSCIFNMPFIFFILNLNKTNEHDKNFSIFLLGTYSWLYLQVCLMSYGRAIAIDTPRYLDVYAMLIMINSGVIIYLLNKYKKLSYKILILFYLIFVIYGFFIKEDEIWTQVRSKSAQGEWQINNLKKYICFGDKDELYKKNGVELSYPDVKRLLLFLDDSTIRNILPTPINPSGCES